MAVPSVCYSYLVCALKHFEEPDIIFAEQTQVLYLILEVCDALDSHAKCISRICLAVNATQFKHVGVYHSATKNFNPTGVLAERTSFSATDVATNVHFGTGLSEWEI